MAKSFAAPCEPLQPGAAARSSAHSHTPCPCLPLTVAKGKTVPPVADLKKVESQICSDPQSAAKQLTKALQAGGAQAQLWVCSLMNANCTDSSGPVDTYEVRH